MAILSSSYLCMPKQKEKHQGYIPQKYHPMVYKTSHRLESVLKVMSNKQQMQRKFAMQFCFDIKNMKSSLLFGKTLWPE